MVQQQSIHLGWRGDASPSQELGADVPKLTDLSNRIVFDVMRAGPGLPAKEAPLSPIRAHAMGVDNRRLQ